MSPLTARRHESNGSAQCVANRFDVDLVPERGRRDSILTVPLSPPIFLAAMLTTIVSTLRKRAAGKQDPTTLSAYLGRLVMTASCVIRSTPHYRPYELLATLDRMPRLACAFFNIDAKYPSIER